MMAQQYPAEAKISAEMSSEMANQRGSNVASEIICRNGNLRRNLSNLFSREMLENLENISMWLPLA